MSIAPDVPLKQILEKHRDAKGSLIPILQDIQDELGYLPESVLRHVSDETGVPYSEVAGVVSFYSYFTTEPRGEHTVRVCLGTACYVRGGNDVLNSIQKELEITTGHTTSDRKFTLEIGRCFGACGLAPVVVVDDDVHQRVRPSCVRELLSRYGEEEGTDTDEQE